MTSCTVTYRYWRHVIPDFLALYVSLWKTWSFLHGICKISFYIFLSCLSRKQEHRGRVMKQKMRLRKVEAPHLLVTSVAVSNPTHCHHHSDAVVIAFRWRIYVVIILNAWWLLIVLVTLECRSIAQLINLFPPFYPPHTVTLKPSQNLQAV